MKSKTPFIGQERSDTCMLACLRMLLAARGVEITETSLVEQTSLAEGGLDPDQLVALAHTLGLDAEARQLNTTEIAAMVRSERFPIVLLDRSLLDDEFAVHAVIPVHFSRDYVFVLDPQRGERRISRRKFAQAQMRVDQWCIALKA